MSLKIVIIFNCWFEHWALGAVQRYCIRSGASLWGEWSPRMKFNIVLATPVAFIFGERVGVVFAQPIPFFFVRIWWNGLYVREGEFHHSLNIDLVASCRMTEEERYKYFLDLGRRRSLAHFKDQ